MSRLSVAILVEASNAYSSGLVKGISKYIWKHGPWNIFYEERTLDSPVPSWFRTWRGDGVIVRSRTQDLALAAVETGAKVVDLGQNRLPGLPTVYPDYAGSSIMAADHLKERLFERFAFVGLKDQRFSRLRREAFCQRLGGSVETFELNQREFLENGAIGSDEFVGWLKRLVKPCGIMVCYDLIGIYVIQACVNAGILVPEEIAVVGVNNDETLCGLSPIPLSSVAQDTIGAGYAAAELLDGLIQGKKDLPTSIVVPPLYVVKRISTDACVSSDKIVGQAMQIILKSACKGLSVHSLSEQLNINRRQLERRFKKFMRRTVHDEIRRIQLQEACQLLSGTKLSIANIARRVGMGASSQLSIVFKARFGQTPGEYRKSVDAKASGGDQ